MNRYFSYIWSAQKILELYRGEMPFAIYLKQFFAQNKKYGSGDRKAIAECCYAWLRCCHLFQKHLVQQNIIKSLFLCTQQQSKILQNVDEKLYHQLHLSIVEKLMLLELDVAQIFPYHSLLGKIDGNQYALSFLIQPLLFLRIRPGREKKVVQQLSRASLLCRHETASKIALPNSSALQQLLLFDKDVVVQDGSSQQVFDNLLKWIDKSGSIVEVWDCCAASGGKSILLNDLLFPQKMRLSISDIRPSILHNCRQRLQRAGINLHYASVADLAAKSHGMADNLFDIIICDVPCSGSGTWSRTPEQLAYFDSEKLASFSHLQSTVSLNVAAQLKPGGLMAYITCSVFEAENEQVVAKLVAASSSLQLLESNYICGYGKRADTMFVAYFKHG